MQPADTNVQPLSSAGACQRFSSHLQLHLSTVTVLLAAAWAMLLHAAASLVAGLSSHTAAARAHLLMLKQSSPSRMFRRAAAAPHDPSATAAQQQLSCRTTAPCSERAVAPCTSTGATAPSTDLVRRRHRSHAPQPAGRDVLQHRSSQDAQHTSAGRAPSGTAAAGSRCAGMARIPMQLQEHRGRLTIALDLDETLLCTYRIEQCGAKGDALQLVPSNTPLGLAPSTPSSSSGGGSSRWPSLLGSRNGAVSIHGSSGSGGGGGSSLGSFRISRDCPDLPGDLGAAARASAWMHYRPPHAPLLRTNSASSSSSDSSVGSTGTSDGGGCAHQQQQLPGAHTLAVFLRPGCQEFLAQLSCFAEVVLFTAAAPEYATPLAQLLDPAGCLFRGQLYADACVQHAGRRGVKDLQVLGRDVRRVVLVDNCLFSFLAQPRNGLPCLPFHGAAEDGQLLGVILPLLRSLSEVGGDIRPLLDSMFRVRHWLASKGYTTLEEL